MNRTTQSFYDKVCEAMQSAEELGGPEGSEYVSLMDAIAVEALRRKGAFLAANPGDVTDVASDAWYVAQAREAYQDEGTIEVDDNAIVSRGDDPGAYVQAWVWVHCERVGDVFEVETGEEDPS